MERAGLEASLNSLDVWLIIFGIFVAIGVVGKSVSGFLHWRRSGQLQALQAADNLALQTAITEANARAAEATRTAENERLERIKLEAKVAPRRLDQEAIVGIAADLAKFSGRKVKVSSFTGDVEAAILGGQIIDALRHAAIVPFDRRMTNSSFGTVAFGILVSGTNASLVAGIVAALIKHLDAAAGLPPQGYPTILAPGEDAVTTEATIFVGVKPLPQ